jgi:hypothetical protein
MLRRSDFITEEEDNRRCQLIEAQIKLGVLGKTDTLLLELLQLKVQQMKHCLTPLPINESLKVENEALKRIITHLESEIERLTHDD